MNYCKTQFHAFAFCNNFSEMNYMHNVTEKYLTSVFRVLYLNILPLLWSFKDLFTHSTATQLYSSNAKSLNRLIIHPFTGLIIIKIFITKNAHVFDKYNIPKRSSVFHVTFPL